MDAIKDLILILRLISDCICLFHPISLDVRYLFHLRISKIDGVAPWESRERWEEVVTGNKGYTLWSLLSALCRHRRFRADVIAVLYQEKGNLLLRKVAAEMEQVDR